MILIDKYKEKSDEFYCEITDELNKLAGIDSTCRWKHYVVADNYSANKRCLPIRIPGGTLGGILLNDEDIVTSIVIDTTYIVKTYPQDVNEQMQKFIGCKIDNIVRSPIQ